MSYGASHGSLKERFAYDIEALKKNKSKFDFMVCQGLSGQSIGFVASYVLGIPLLILRKPNKIEFSKRAKSGYSLLEGADMLRLKKGARVCFVDDCISSGFTRGRCGRAVHDAGGVVTCQMTGQHFETLHESTIESFKSFKVDYNGRG